MIILACGGRDYQDVATVFRTLDAAHAAWGVTALFHGDAKGADRLAAAWAQNRGIPVHAFPADWDMHGKAAGGIRNQGMLQALMQSGPHVAVVAFPGGRGTRDMVAKAEHVGVRVFGPVPG